MRSGRWRSAIELHPGLPPATRDRYAGPGDSDDFETSISELLAGTRQLSNPLRIRSIVQTLWVDFRLLIGERQLLKLLRMDWMIQLFRTKSNPSRRWRRSDRGNYHYSRLEYCNKRPPDSIGRPLSIWQLRGPYPYYFRSIS